MNHNTRNKFSGIRFADRKAAMLVLQLTRTAIWVLIIVLISSCGAQPSVTQPPVTKPPQGTEPPITEAPGIVTPCADQSIFTCTGWAGHEISLDGVPAGFHPNLLSITRDLEQELLNKPTEGTLCIFAIAGDLAFFDDNNKPILNPKFSQPVKITYVFSDKDMAAFEDCKAKLTQANKIAAETKVDYVPVYFSNNVWRPFNEKDYTIDGQQVTLTVSSWGDSPVGGGTKP